MLKSKTSPITSRQTTLYMGTSPRPQRDPQRIGNIKRNIFQGTKDADYFHKLGLQYQAAGNETLAEKALSAEKACRENVLALERELTELA